MTAEPVREADARAPLEPSTDPAGWLDRHGDALFRHALARVGRRDQAEDLVQETFLAAFQARHRFFGRSSERTWLVAILRHKIADRRRHDSKTRGPALEPAPRLFDDGGHWIEAPSRWQTPPDALDADEFRTALDGCLGRLPDHLADAFRLREVEGVAVESLREILSVSAANLRVRLHRARLLLRDCLQRHAFGPDAAPAEMKPDEP